MGYAPLFLLFLLFCWLTLFHLLFIGAWVPRRKTLIPSQCPSCKYSLAGLDSAICPECGGDCSNVKLDPGAAADSERPRDVRFACRILLVAIVAVPLWLYGYIAAPREVRFMDLRVQTPTDAWTGLTIRASASRSMAIDSQYSSSLRAGRVRATVSGPTGTKRFKIVDRWYRAEYETERGVWVKTSDAFQDQDVIAWLVAAGVDATKPGVLKEAKELEVALRNAAVGTTSMLWNGTLPPLTWSLGFSDSGRTYLTPSWTYSSVLLFASGLICFLSIRPLLRPRDLNPIPRDSVGS